MIHAGNKKPRERQLDGEGSDDRPRKDVMKSYSLLLRSIEKSPMPHQRSRSDLPNPATPASLSWRWEPLQRKGVLKEICEKTETRAGGSYPFCERLCDDGFAPVEYAIAWAVEPTTS